MIYYPTMTLLSPNTKKHNHRIASKNAYTLTKQEKQFLKIDFNHRKMAAFSANLRQQKRIDRIYNKKLEKISLKYIFTAREWTILQTILDIWIGYRLYTGLLTGLKLLGGDMWNQVVLSVYFMVYCMVVTNGRNRLRRLFGNFIWKTCVLMVYICVSGIVLQKILVYPLNELPGYNARINF